MKVYIVLEQKEDSCDLPKSRILRVFSNEYSAQSYIKGWISQLIKDENFFLHYIFKKYNLTDITQCQKFSSYEDECDTIELDEGSLYLYDDRNGNKYKIFFEEYDIEY